MKKHDARIRRGLKTKAIIKNSTRARLVVYRSLTHIYAQITTRGDKGDVVLISSSSIDAELRKSLTGNKVDQAFQVGKALGERAKQISISEVAFDRSGYHYHGRIKALADGAREAGLEF